MTFAEEVERFKRELLERVIAAQGGNRHAAARVLGLPRSYFYWLCRRHCVELPPPRKRVGRPRSPAPAP